MTTKQKKQTKHPWTSGEKGLVWVIGMVLALTGSGTLWYQRDNTLPPAVSIPTPVMPPQNAFDYFAAAARAETQAQAVDDANANFPPPGASPNAPFQLHYAYTLAQKQALVRANALALRLLREGLTLPYQPPPIRSFATPLPYYAHFRTLARLLNLAGEADEQQGDWDSAVRAHLDSVQEGVLMQQGSPVIGMLVGIACQAIGRKPLWGDIAHLTAPQAEAAARRMERICVQQVSFADILQQEKWTGEAGLREALAAPDWQQVLAQDAGYRNGLDTKQRIAALFVSRSQVWYDYVSYMDAEIAIARRPYAANIPAPAMPSDLLAATFLMDASDSRFRFVDNATQNALLTVALALRAYKAQHGAYPVSLKALIPQYLVAIPDDPFAGSGPVRYKRTGATCLLYSVGPDGKDNNGAPLTSAPGTSNPNNFDMPNSAGDIVTGINTE